MSAPEIPTDRLPRWLLVVLLLGIYLTLRGYHSRDGDQAYRLPLLLHRQDPALFANDPFVRAFDAFNPHRGALVLLDLASRPLGLSAGLALLFALTFAATCLGVDRLARSVWPELGPRVGLVALGLFLTAKAGNIGTNHLFEAMLLDRLVALALGWLALAEAVERPRRGWVTSAVLIGLATLVHPSMGLQLALLLAAGWIAWGLLPVPSEVPRARSALGLLALGVALIPGMLVIAGQSARLLQGLSPDEFRWLSVELQGPQHMLPHLWRRPQWLAWACYPLLALLTLAQAPRGSWNPSRLRLLALLAINLAALAAAWVAVEVLHSLRITVFQPFRMATVARGLALIVVSGRVLALWRSGNLVNRMRAALLAVGLAGDRTLVVATFIDLGLAAYDALSPLARNRRPATVPSRFGVAGVPSPEPRSSRPEQPSPANHLRTGLFAALSLSGLLFLSRHDTESGHRPLLLTLTAVVIGSVVYRYRQRSRQPKAADHPSPALRSRRRLAALTVACWAVPAACLLASLWPADAHGKQPRWAESLCRHCRFTAVPLDDTERLAVWCRENTPADARFIGPPGPKTFRLWSQRNLAFNRAGSPYHAEGLADWAARYRDHVDFHGPIKTFVRRYVANRHKLERRYDELTPAERAALAHRQGAQYLIAAPPSSASRTRPDAPLELLHIEGRTAVYRVRSPNSAKAANKEPGSGDWLRGAAKVPVPISGRPPRHPKSGNGLSARPQARASTTASAGTG